MKTAPKIGGALVALLLLGGCGGEDLADADPEGYKACSAYALSVASTDPNLQEKSLNAAARSASNASTPEIRDTAALILATGDGGDLPLACYDAGFDF